MKTNKILSTILALTILSSTPVMAASIPKPVSTLSSIQVEVPDGVSEWVLSSYDMALKHQLVPETLQSKYNEDITRGELSVLVVKLYEKIKGKEIVERKSFTDTKDINVSKVAGLGIITGYDNGTFKPNEKMTREQTATVLYRLMNKLGYKFVKDYEYIEYYMGEGVNGTAKWALEPTILLYHEQIIYAGDLYEPKSFIPVDEVIHSLMRVFYLTSNHQFEGYTKAYQDQAKQVLNTFKAKYPTGTPWGLEKKGIWRGKEKTGCEAFVAELSDAIFGDSSVLTHDDFEAIKIGDVLSVKHDTHAVIVVDIVGDTVIVAEGNFNGKVRWGDKYTKEKFTKEGSHVETRYPKVTNPANFRLGVYTHY